jgi:hypothetical protein
LRARKVVRVPAWPAVALPVALAFTAAVAGGQSIAAPVRVSGCERPLTYDVVRVDSGHHVSRAAFVALLERSERLWESPAGRDLLRYQPGGTVKVSLIYDNRQIAYDNEQVIRNKIVAADAAIARMRADLERQRAAIHAEEAQFKARKARLSVRINYWNGRGGAPQGLVVALKAEDAAIRHLVAAINADLRRENASVAHFRATLRGRNALVPKHGDAEQELGHAQLGGTEVSISVLTGTAKDEVLVAHEFGHILGLKHIPGADNIMNPFLVKALGYASPADLQALQTLCESR